MGALDEYYPKINRPITCRLLIIFTLAVALILILTSIASAEDTWTNNGPENKNVKSVRISPNFTKDYTIFAGTAEHGVYRSTDGGKSWVQINNGLTNLKVRSVYVSLTFSSDRTVFAGTAGGVFKSIDAGDNWTQVNTGLTNTDVKSIVLSPNFASDKTVFTGTAGGVYKSTDGGTTWVQVNTGLTNTDVRCLAISPDYALDQSVFAGTYGGGLFKSADGGASWAHVNNGLSNLLINDIAVSPDFSSDKTLFVGTYGDGVFKSTDGCASWLPSNDGISTADYYIFTIAISPDYAHDDTVFVGTNGGVYRSKKGGEAWKNASKGLLHKLIPSIDPSPCYCLDKTVFAGSDGGGVYSCIFSTAPDTTLSTDPLNPDGEDGWFITAPMITLTSDKSGTTYYQWDSTSTAGWITYSGSFPALEGQHTLYYFSMDVAGNKGPTRSQEFKVDMGEPVDPTVSSTSHTEGGWSNVNTIKVTISGASDEISGVAGYSIEWSKSSGTTPDSVLDLGASETVATSPALEDGSWYFHLRTKDLAGNWTSTVHLGPFHIDTVASTVSIETDPPAADGNDGWFITKPTITLKISESGTIYYQWDSTTGSWTTYANSFTALEGEHTLYYYAKDTAGNVSVIKSRTFKVDTVAPAAFNISEPEDGATGNNATATTFTWSASSDSMLAKYQLYVDSALVADNISASATSYTLSKPLDPGTYTWYIKAVDSAGNEVASTSTFTLTVADVVAPSTSLTTNPSVTDGGYGWFKTTPSITLSRNEPGTTYYQWDSTTGSWTTYTSGFSAMEGEHTLYYYSVDASGNKEAVKSKAIKVDTVTPNAFNISSPSDGSSTDNASLPTFSWDASSDSNSGLGKYQLFVDGSLVKDGITETSYTLTKSLAAGSHTWNVKAFDYAGNGVDSTSTFTINVSDVVAPTTTVYSDPSYTNGWFNTSPTITLTRDEEGTTYYQWNSTTGGWLTYTGAFKAPSEDGEHILYYHSVDKSNNKEETKSKSFKIDKNAPNAFDITEPADGTVTDNASKPTFKWIASSDSTSGLAKYQIYVDGVLKIDNISASATSYTLSSPLDPGNHTWYVKAVDNAGNSTSSTSTYDLTVNDIVAPATTLSTNPSSPDGTNGWFKTNPSITLSRNEPGTTYYQWDSTTGSWTTYTGSFNAPEGQHTLYYYSVDTSGNVEGTKNKAFKVDTVAPSAFDLSSPADGSTLDNSKPQTFSWTASSDTNSGFRYQLYIDGSLVKDGITTTSYTLSKSLDPGSHTWQVKAVDYAGNVTSSTPQSFSVTVVDVVPPTTSLSTSPSSPDGTNGWFKTNPSITLSRNEPGTTYYQWDSTTGPWVANASSSIAISGLEGDHTLYYYSVDSVGNTESVKNKVIKVDTQAPAAFDLVNPADNSTTDNATKPTFEWAASSDANTLKYQLYIDGKLAKDSITTTSYTLSAPLDPGSHTWYVNAVDIAGNTTKSTSTYSLSVADVLPPTTSLSTNPVSPDGLNGWFKTSPSVTLSRNEPGTTYYQWDSSTGPWIAYTATTGGFKAPEGQHTLYYYSEDAVGNKESMKSQVFKVDTSAPASSITSPADGERISGATYNITGSASDASSGVAKVEISINGGSWLTATGTTSWSYSWTLPEDGSYKIKARSTDIAGNVQSSIQEISVIVDNTRPTVTSVSPEDGAVDVAESTVVTATFNENMDSSTINTTTFTLKDAANNPVSGAVTYDSASKKATFKPSSSLAYSTTYTATVTTGAKDIAGGGLEADKVWSFATREQTLAPVTSISVEPSSPDGNDGWYKTVPTITLTADKPGTIYYKWDSATSWTTYTGSFKALEGEHTLHYYSKGTDGNNEDTKSQVFKVDSKAPSVPANIKAVAQSSSSILISWDASTDNVAVKGYDIYNADTNQKIGTTAETSFTHSGLSANTKYRYYVKAFDAAGNVSAASATVEATTFQSSQETGGGTNVNVDLGNGVKVKFDSVTKEGETSAEIETNPPYGAPDSNFRLRGYVINIQTTANYAGMIEVTITYDEKLIKGKEKNLKLMHHNGQHWEDITVSVDTVNNTITGVTSSLSPFSAAEDESLIETSQVPASSTWSLLLMSLFGLAIIKRSLRRKMT